MYIALSSLKLLINPHAYHKQLPCSFGVMQQFWWMHSPNSWVELFGRLHRAFWWWTCRVITLSAVIACTFDIQQRWWCSGLCTIHNLSLSRVLSVVTLLAFQHQWWISSEVAEMNVFWSTHFVRFHQVVQLCISHKIHFNEISVF